MYQNRGGFQRRRDFGPRKNEYIRVPEIRVIGPEGENLEVMKTEDALKIAQEAGLDLVEVSPDAKPPVCKIIDYAKYQYQQNKKKRKSRQKTKNMKEFQFSPVIDVHDRETRMRRAKEYLDQGHLVRLIMRLRGRQTREQATPVFREILTNFDQYSTIEPGPKIEGRQIYITLKTDGKAKNKKNSSKKDKKDQSKGKSKSKADVRKDRTAPPKDKKVVKSKAKKS